MVFVEVFCLLWFGLLFLMVMLCDTLFQIKICYTLGRINLCSNKDPNHLYSLQLAIAMVRVLLNVVNASSCCYKVK